MVLRTPLDPHWPCQEKFSPRVVSLCARQTMAVSSDARRNTFARTANLQGKGHFLGHMSYGGRKSLCGSDLFVPRTRKAPSWLETFSSTLAVFERPFTRLFPWGHRMNVFVIVFYYHCRDDTLMHLGTTPNVRHRDMGAYLEGKDERRTIS